MHPQYPENPRMTLKRLAQVEGKAFCGFFANSTAKSLVSDRIGIDMLAGPTELGIIADNSANPKFIEYESS